MKITLDYRNPTPAHCDVAVFVNDALSGVLKLRQEEIDVFQHIVLHGMDDRRDQFVGTGNPGPLLPPGERLETSIEPRVRDQAALKDAFTAYLTQTHAQRPRQQHRNGTLGYGEEEWLAFEAAATWTTIAANERFHDLEQRAVGVIARLLWVHECRSEEESKGIAAHLLAAGADEDRPSDAALRCAERASKLQGLRQLCVKIAAEEDREADMNLDLAQQLCDHAPEIIELIDNLARIAPPRSGSTDAAADCGALPAMPLVLTVYPEGSILGDAIRAYGIACHQAGAASARDGGREPSR